MRSDLRLLSAWVVGAIAVSGCGASSGSNSKTPNTVQGLGGNVMQLAVGTANIYGGCAPPCVAMTGLNVMTTYRQPKGGTAPGDSGALVNSPTFAVPAGSIVAPVGLAGGPDGISTIVTGPIPTEVPNGPMTSTSQTPPAPTNTTVSTFGQSGGIFGLGIEPFNYAAATGTPWTVAPYPVPLYDTLTGTTGDPNQIPAAWGGPPAFDLLGNGESPVGSGIVPAGTAGISEGIDVFEGVNPVAGSAYTLTLTIAGTSQGTFTKSATATMASTALLPNIAAATYAPDGNGGGGFSVTLPAGVTEAYIEVEDLGTDTPGAVNCNGGGIFYTLEVTPSTAQPVVLGDAAGPGGAPSICTVAQNTAANGGTATDSDVIAVSTIGFDYPVYEASYPNSKGNPAPTIANAAGQADITISPAATYGGAAGGTGFRRGFSKYKVQKHAH